MAEEQVLELPTVWGNTGQSIRQGAQPGLLEQLFRTVLEPLLGRGDQLPPAGTPPNEKPPMQPGPTLGQLMTLATLPAFAEAPALTMAALLSSQLMGKVGGQAGGQLGGLFGPEGQQRGEQLGSLLGSFLVPGMRASGPARGTRQLPRGQETIPQPLTQGTQRFPPSPEVVNLHQGSRPQTQRLLSLQPNRPPAVELPSVGVELTAHPKEDIAAERLVHQAAEILGQTHPHVMASVKAIDVVHTLPKGAAKGATALYRVADQRIFIKRNSKEMTDFPKLVGTLAHELTHHAQEQAPARRSLTYEEKLQRATPSDPTIFEPAAYSRGEITEKNLERVMQNLPVLSKEQRTQIKQKYSPLNPSGLREENKQ